MRRVLIILSLAALTAAVFWPVTSARFIQFDDTKYITANSQVQGGLSLAGVAWAFRSTAPANWHPLTWLAHMLDIDLYGMNAGGHHLTNLLIHIANAILLFLLLELATGASWRSAFVAALFAVHPLHVESVAWVSERKDVLCAFFWFLSMIAWVRYAKIPAKLPYALSLICFALGLMSKPMIVTLPFLLLLLDHWPLKRFANTATKARLKIFLEKIPFFLLAAASAAITYAVQKGGGAVVPLEKIALVTRISGAFVNAAGYIEKMFWPSPLAFFYPYPDAFPPWRVVASAAFVLGVSTLAVLWIRRRPYFFVGWFWYLIALMPVIGIVQVGKQAMADRYTYVPLIGIFIIIAWGAHEAIASRAKSALLEKFAAAVALAVILALGCAARVQAGYWHNDMTLLVHAMESTEDNYVAHHSAGLVMASKGNWSDAIREYEEVLRIRPGYYFARNNMGVALASIGRDAEALAQFEEIARQKPDYAMAHFNIAGILAARARIAEAINEYREAIRLDPDMTEAKRELARLTAGENAPPGE